MDFAREFLRRMIGGQAGVFAEDAQFVARAVAMRTMGIAHQLLPHAPERIMIMRGIGGQREALVFGAGDQPSIPALFPLRNLISRDAKRGQIRSHVIGNLPQIFADDVPLARLLEHGEEIFLSVAPVLLAVFCGIIGSRLEAGQWAARARSRFVEAQRKEFGVARRMPRKPVDAVKPEHVIDAKEIEKFAHAMHTLPPPAEPIRLVSRPIVQRDAPVLAPFLDKGVMLENPIRRSAAAPAGPEEFRMRPDIGALKRDAKGNVAHQADAAAARRAP